VCLSATHIAYGSIRMEPVFMVLAQSSAFAAQLAIDGNLDVQDVPIESLQQRIRSMPLATPEIFDVTVDNDDEGTVKVKGNWKRETDGGYGPTFLLHDGTGSGTVRFTPDIPGDGSYQVYAYFPKQDRMAQNTSVAVSDGKKTNVVTIRASDIQVEGQTSGEWAPLGTFTFRKGKKGYVEISTQGANGVVVADAVVWVPKK
jgi:hypothetical protein